MFPQIEIADTEAEEPSQTIGKVFKFDFSKGEYVVQNGKLVEMTKLEAVKQFITWTLKTQARKFKIYPESYGIDKESFIGKKTLPTGFIQSEIKRQISEQLTVHPFIERIEDFTSNKENDKLVIEFTVITAFNQSLRISEVI